MKNPLLLLAGLALLVSAAPVTAQDADAPKKAYLDEKSAPARGLLRKQTRPLANGKSREVAAL